jgi:type IV pilus assembly protein PilC
MPTFVYEARRKTGEQVSGSQEAADQKSALEALRAQDLFVTALKQQKGFRREGGRGEAPRPQHVPGVIPMTPAGVATVGGGGEAIPQNIPQQLPRLTKDTQPVTGAAAPLITTQPWLTANSKELSLYYRQLFAMLNAGTSLAHALTTMGQHAPNAALRNASLQMAERTAMGAPFSAQMVAFPGIFKELAIGMIAAGENGGFLDRMCLRLAEYSERDYELQQTIKRETWYPKLLVFCSILIPSVVPLVLANINGGNPLLAWFRSVGPPFFFIGIVWLGWKFYSRVMPVATHGGVLRETIDSLKLSFPGASKTTRSLAAAKFCRALAALYASGAGASKMVDTAAGASGNAAFAKQVRAIIPEIQNGVSMTEALTSTKQFPGVALQMMQTGEVSGRLDEQLDKVADFMEMDAETAIKQSVKVLGIVVFLMVAMYIGSIIFNFYSQYAGTMNQIMDET